MKEKTISVIVPVYNTERYLAACLDSIRSQSYKNIEIIVINDGSTDFSFKIAETYAEKDDRIKVYSYENEGLSEARNRGLNVATGEYVTFVDSDDMLFPRALDIMADQLENENVGLVEGKIIKGKDFTEGEFKESFNSVIYSPLEAITDVLYQKRLLPSACGKLYRKDLFENLRFEKGILYEDLNIFYRILEKCNEIVWINYPVYFYRLTEGSITNSWNPQRLDVLKVTEDIENYIQENYPQLLPPAKDRRLSANFNMYSLCNINGDKENAKRCWQHIKLNRSQSLRNPHVRLKNKAGILLSYLGRNIFNIAARKIYK